MYPDNYMNPMNNPMTNPNYGYNRMQQVQQMQRAINPQVPNMFGQVEQPQQMQSLCLHRVFLQGRIRFQCRFKSELWFIRFIPAQVIC